MFKSSSSQGFVVFSFNILTILLNPQDLVPKFSIALTSFVTQSKMKLTNSNKSVLLQTGSTLCWWSCQTFPNTVSVYWDLGRGAGSLVIILMSVLIKMLVFPVICSILVAWFNSYYLTGAYNVLGSRELTSYLGKYLVPKSKYTGPGKNTSLISPDSLL